MDCWIITEGLAGTENQCIGIAEALGVRPRVMRVKLRQPWKTLSPYIGFENGSSFDPPLHGPWPDLLLAGGRKAIAAARYIRKASQGKTFTVFIQDPKTDPAQFDLVIAPAHDSVQGSNVLKTTAAPNRITDEKLGEAKSRFPYFESLKTPRVAVLIGGSSRAHRMTTRVAERMAEQLKNLDAGLMITASRRTEEKYKTILKKKIPARNAWFWNGEEENPYFAILAWADYIIVTSDSVSMLSEAATAGKPVYMVPLEGGSPRLDTFHKNLRDQGIARIFEGKLERWEYRPLRDAQKAADEIKKRLKNRG
jgi:uncharacterized protein